MSDVLDKLLGGLKAIAPTVANIALPGSGSAVEAILRKVAGSPPEAPMEQVAAKIAADPLLYLEAKRQILVAENRANEIEAGIVTTVNATMQVEAKSEHWAQWGWRPYWGFVSASAFGVVCVYVMVLLHRAVIGGQAEIIASIPAIVSAIAMLFGIPAAILGVASWHRGVEKRIKAGDAPAGPTLVGAVAGRIRGK